MTVVLLSMLEKRLTEIWHCETTEVRYHKDCEDVEARACMEWWRLSMMGRKCINRSQASYCVYVCVMLLQVQKVLQNYSIPCYWYILGVRSRDVLDQLLLALATSIRVSGSTREGSLQLLLILQDKGSNTIGGWLTPLFFCLNLYLSIKSDFTMQTRGVECRHNHIMWPYGNSIAALNQDCNSSHELLHGVCSITCIQLVHNILSHLDYEPWTLHCIMIITTTVLCKSLKLLLGESLEIQSHQSEPVY